MTRLRGETPENCGVLSHHSINKTNDLPTFQVHNLLTGKLLLSTFYILKNVAKINEKSAQREANTARALALVRFGHRPLARPLSQTQRQDRLQYTAPQLASAQCKKR